MTIAGLIATLACLLVLAGYNGNAELGQTDEPQWREAYAELLRDYMMRPSPIEWDVRRVFTLFDIDKDGIPELMIFYLDAGFATEAIYTFSSGEPIEVEGGIFIYYYRAFERQDNKPGIIMAMPYSHPHVADISSFRLLVLDDNRLIDGISITHAREDWVQWWNGQEVPRARGWYINDTMVTEADYNEVFDDIFRGWRNGDGLRHHALDEENIRLVIFGWNEI